MIKAVLFDLDGVLTTDATGSESICKYLSNKTGIDYELLLSEYRRYNNDLLYGKITHEDMWEDFCKVLGVPIDLKLLHESFIYTPIDKDMEKLVAGLKASGYKTGMVTNNKKDRIDAMINHMHWTEHFDVVAISADIGSGKDNESIFLKTLEDIGCNGSECVFIDNSESNLIVPKGMGIHTIYFDHDKRDMASLCDTLIHLGVQV